MSPVHVAMWTRALLLSRARACSSSPSLAFACALLPRTAIAQEFSDDAETGTVLVSDVPAGNWTGRFEPTGNTFVASAQAAHRGSYGLRLTDTRSGTTGTSEGQLYETFPTLVPTTYYVRYWFRVSTSNQQGSFVLSMTRADDAQNTELANPWVGAGATLDDYGFGGRDSSRTYLNDPVALNAPTNTWHLVEVATTGVGTSNGRRRLWVDGALVGERTAIDWSTFQVKSFVLGPIWSGTPTFVGTLDYDDVRGSQSELASTFAISANAPATAGACVPLTVTMESSAGNAAPAPYDFTAPISSSGAPASFYSDAACAVATTSVAFTTGGSSADLWMRAASEGNVTAVASHVDFLPGGGVILVGPSVDGGMSSDAGSAEDGGSGPGDAGELTAPVAVVSPASQTVAAGGEASLDASGSSSPAGSTISTWTWRQVEGPGYVELPAEAKVTLKPSEPGTYAFELVVTDDAGRSSSPARAEVIVSGDPFVPPDSISGCGCDSGAGAPSLLAVVGLALVVWRSGRVARRQSTGADTH